VQSLATFLFKYPSRVFARGDLTWAPVLPVALIALALAAALVLVVMRAAALKNVRRRDRVVLAVLRALVFIIVAMALCRPSLALTAAVPQRNVLAIMLDNSRSMNIRDADSSTRLAAVTRTFADSTALIRRLSDRFTLRFFSFSGDAAPIHGAVLDGTGTRTDLAAAIGAVRDNLADLPVAGIVMATDGADNATTDIDAAVAALRTSGIPLYTVGVGSAQFRRDLSLDRLDVPATTLKGSGTLVTATIGVRGMNHDSTTVVVEADGHIVDREPLPLAGKGEVVNVPLRLPPLDVGNHVLLVSVLPVRGELIPDNNQRRALLRVRPGFERVLYLEGEPRFEFSFLRRAFADDSAVRLVGLLRSAKGKFLRINVQDSLDLLGGFPTRRSELFRYRALILGDVEATFFTGDQLRMIADFVDRRGGALIALGGRSALGDGGYAGTALADVLPVTLEKSGRASHDTAAVPLKVTPTAEGLLHPALQLAGTAAGSAARWDSLPVVTTVNALGDVRPGATVLLENRADHRPVLITQRYGRGIATVFGVQDSWLWKMDPRAPLDDRSYENFWHQLVRWNLDQVPERVDVTAEPARAVPGDAIVLHAHVVDSEYVDVDNAAVTATVTSPSGKETDLPLDWTLREDGSYAGRFVADEPGTWRYQVIAIAGGDTSRASASAALADATGADMDHAELRQGLLERLASVTQGKYYGIDDLSHLPDDVQLTHSGITAHESRDLWDMPIVLLVLLILLGIDWAWRRWRGLA
jgi:uncharacterized membrane protein